MNRPSTIVAFFLEKDKGFSIISAKRIRRGRAKFENRGYCGGV
jgi:hypothetical protein